jgi:hypothetical protein
VVPIQQQALHGRREPGIFARDLLLDLLQDPTFPLAQHDDLPISPRPFVPGMCSRVSATGGANANGGTS